MKEYKKSLFEFIKASPTAFQAVDELKCSLEEDGYEALDLEKKWNVKRRGKYYVTRNHSSLIAFEIPEERPEGFSIVAAHTDSPSFKVKASPEIVVKDDYVKINVEKYGGMILSTWFDRPLSVAGRIFIKNEQGLPVERLVNIDRNLFVIPNLAIHMNHELNQGYQFQVQRDLLPIFSENSKAKLADLIADYAGINKESILSEELYLYARQEGTALGQNGEWIHAPRLDDLQCVYAALQGLRASKPKDFISLAAFFDNEEVGSGTKQGADSDFLSLVLERILLSLSIEREEGICMLQKSFLISADNAHAVHPNHPEKADLTNRPKMNKGIVIKFHGGQKYTTDGSSAARLMAACDKIQVPYQIYHNHSDVLGGSTLGNIATTHVSVPSVDIGFAQLAMHSAVETAGSKDLAYGISLFTSFFSR